MVVLRLPTARPEPYNDPDSIPAWFETLVPDIALWLASVEPACLNLVARVEVQYVGRLHFRTEEDFSWRDKLVKHFDP